MSDTPKTPGGQEFYEYAPDEMPGHPVFVVLRISGEYSSISWTVVCAAESRDAAVAWMDANPIPKEKWASQDCYEVHATALFTLPPAPPPEGHR